MLKKMVTAAMLAGALGACETLTGQDAATFDPAACYEREFNVYFDGAEATLSPAAIEAIDAVGAAVQGCRVDHVRIIGMADAGMEAEISEELSQQRAVTIKDYTREQFHWRDEVYELRARGDRGAVTDEGLNRPLRSRARVVVRAVAP